MIMERGDFDVGGDGSKRGKERAPIIIQQHHTLTFFHASPLMDLIEEVLIPRVPCPERVEGHPRRSIQLEAALGALEPNLSGAPFGWAPSRRAIRRNSSTR